MNIAHKNSQRVKPRAQRVHRSTQGANHIHYGFLVNDFMFFECVNKEVCDSCVFSLFLPFFVVCPVQLWCASFCFILFCFVIFKEQKE